MSGSGLRHGFWPVGEAAQADYEALREQELAGERAASISAARFARRGLAGLIAWPAAEPVFTGSVLAGTRPRWSPHDDPRLDALAAGFAFLLGIDTPKSTSAMMEGLQ